MRTCIDCGASIEHRHHTAERCEECAAKRNRELSKEYKRQKRAEERKRLGIEPFDNSECQGCCFYNEYGFCDFCALMGMTRSSLHPGEPLNNPCREREEGPYGMVRRMGAVCR